MVISVSVPESWKHRWYVFLASRGHAQKTRGLVWCRLQHGGSHSQAKTGGDGGALWSWVARNWHWRNFPPQGANHHGDRPHCFHCCNLECPSIMFHILSSSVQACQAGNAAAAAALIALAPETGLVHTAHTSVYNPFYHDESLRDVQGNLSVTRAVCYLWP